MRLPDLIQLELLPRITKLPRKKRTRNRPCINCGINFYLNKRASRRDTKYHSIACKQKAYRARKRNAPPLI